MSCDPLPSTGLDAGVGPLLVLAIVLTAVGTTMVVLDRRRGRRTLSGVLVAFLLIGGGTTVVGVSAPTPAQAGCSSSDDHLVVTQTSTMTGLAPGVAPVPITGRLVNESQDSTYVTAVDVEITSVTGPAGSPTEACGPRDYRLGAPRMHVGSALGPGEAVAFSGAEIGFADKDRNQDACQSATVNLLYTANPG